MTKVLSKSVVKREVQQLRLDPLSIHPDKSCAGRPCVIHAPSGHHMNKWPKNWRSDIRIMERLCPHGIGHPDPDDTAYRMSIGDNARVHGCDGCCVKAV